MNKLNGSARGTAARGNGESLVKSQRCPATVMKLNVSESGCPPFEDFG